MENIKNLSDIEEDIQLFELNLEDLFDLFIRQGFENE